MSGPCIPVVSDVAVLGLVFCAGVLPWCCAGASARSASFRREAGVETARKGTRVRAAADGSGSRVDLLVVLALIDVALSSGASVMRALVAVGRAVGGDDGRALEAVASALSLGAEWHGAWAQVPARLTPVQDCLRGSWTAGSAAGPSLRATAAQIRRRRRQESREAAGRLGVQLVLPLGLCLLPACMLMGLVPMALSLAVELWR